MELFRLNQTIQNQEASLLMKEDEVANLRRQNDDLQAQLNSCKIMNQKLEDQLLSKNRELLDKVKELDLLKQKYEDAYSTMR
jgi:chromosome segregation ATPase